MTPDYLNSLVTFVVGLLAFVVYWLSKRHEKKNAAAIIVMDIRHAEQVILSLLERGTIDRSGLKPILHENNWAKYNHLFASDFSYDDLAAPNRFFDSCVEIADARRRMNEVFFAAVNAKAELLQQRIIDIDEIETPEGQEKRQKLIGRFNKEAYAFDPQDPKNTVQQHLSLMGRPSNSPAFAKLKRTAGIGA